MLEVRGGAGLASHQPCAYFVPEIEPVNPDPSRKTRTATQADTVVATLGLFSPSWRPNAPYTRGVTFAPGAVPRGAYALVEQASVMPLATYADGSLRLARVSGYVPASLVKAGASQNVTIPVKLAASPPAPLFFRHEAPPVVVTTEFGTARGNGAMLTVGSDAHMRVKVEHIAYPNGEWESTVIIENGFLKVPGSADRSGQVKVELGGKTVLDQKIVLEAHCRAKLGTFWTGCDDPRITPTVDRAALEAFGLPHYGTRAIPEYVLTSLAQSFPSGSPGDGSPTLGITGYQARIGLLPDHAARAIVSNDARAIRNTLANADTAFHWPVHYRDETTGRPVRFDHHPWLSISASGHGDYPANGTGPQTLHPDIAHLPQQLLLAYLLTARDLYLEEMIFWDAWVYMTNTDTGRRGAEGLFRAEAGANQTRGTAWGLRSRCQLLAVLPSDHPNFPAVKASVEANFAMFRGRYVDGSFDETGLSYDSFARGDAKNDLGLFLGFDRMNPDGIYGIGGGEHWGDGWMNSFVVQMLGHAFDLKLPVSEKAGADLKSARDHGYRFIVGLCGDGSPGSFDYRRFDVFALPVGKAVNNKLVWYRSWGEVWKNYTVKLPPLPDDKIIRYHDSNNAMTEWASGFAGNHLPALSYAVKHGAPGAREAYARVTASDSWKLTGDFVNGPQFGILPPDQFFGAVTAQPVAAAAAVAATPAPANWVPPSGYFADIPTRNLPRDATPPIYMPNDAEVLFDHWTGGAILYDYGKKGALAICGAGHYTSPLSPDIQFVLTLSFDDLTWRASNAPAKVNTQSMVGADVRYPDGTYPIPHPYNGLQEWPHAWGGGPKGSLVNFGIAGSSQLNFAYAFDVSKAIGGHSRLTPGVVAFNNDNSNDKGAFPGTVIDRKRQGWWYAKSAVAERIAFIGKDGSITYHPAIGGNNTSMNLMRDEKRDLLFILNGGRVGDKVYNDCYVRDVATGQNYVVKVSGDLPLTPDGLQNDPDRCGFEYVEAMDAFVGRDCHQNPPSYLVMTLGADPKKDGIVSRRVMLKHWTAGDPKGSPVLVNSTNGDWGKHRHVPQLGPRTFVVATHANVRPQVVTL